jgi:hypothetical protein
VEHAEARRLPASHSALHSAASVPIPAPLKILPMATAGMHALALCARVHGAIGSSTSWPRRRAPHFISLISGQIHFLFIWCRDINQCFKRFNLALMKEGRTSATYCKRKGRCIDININMQTNQMKAVEHLNSN